jgi:glycerol-3-phosphate dehydrogenase
MTTGVRLKIKKQENCSDLKGKAIINATGVFTNAIMKLNDTVYKKYIVPSQGIHLVFDKSFLPSDHALMIKRIEEFTKTPTTLLSRYRAPINTQI